MPAAATRTAHFLTACALLVLAGCTPPPASPPAPPPSDTAAETQAPQATPTMVRAAIEPSGILQTDPVLGSDFSPDGRFAELLTSEETLLVDLSTMEVAASIPGDALGRIAFGPAGEFAAATQEGELWSGRISESGIAQIETGAAPVFRAAYSPDGSRIIAGSSSGEVFVMDALSGEILHHTLTEAFGTESSTVWLLGFSPDSTKAAVSFSNPGAVWIGDARSLLEGAPEGRLITWLEHAGPIAEARIAPDWQRIVWVSRATLQVMTLDGESIGGPVQGTDVVQVLQFLPDSPVLLYTSNSIGQDTPAGLIRVVDLQTGEVIYEVRGPGRITRFVLSQDGQAAAAGFEGGEIIRFDPANGEVLSQTPASGSPVTSLAFTPSGDVLAAYRDDGKLDIDGADAELQSVIALHFDPGGERLIAIASSGEHHIFYIP